VVPTLEEKFTSEDKFRDIFFSQRK